MIVNVVVSEADALINFVLNKAEKHVPSGELVRTAECTVRSESRCALKLRYVDLIYQYRSCR
jgi:hypothetical protein